MPEDIQRESAEERLGKFLFVFGYQSPEIWGTDLENSEMVWILAPTEPAALEWGQEIAERFCRERFPHLQGWKSQGFANWIVHDEYETFEMARKTAVPICRVGEFPRFT